MCPGSNLFEGRRWPLLIFLCAVDSSPRSITGRGIQACLPCHQSIVESYVQTNHFGTSRLAGPNSIKGSFAAGRNTLRTRRDQTWFEMERRDGGFFQTAHTRAGERSERIDLVIGSGRRGQSYLYWREGLLYQLPVSWHAAAGGWINSPGYEDGAANFDRPVPEQCLSCHVTYLSASRRVLGISCEKCHGAVTNHAELRRIETCSGCHSGAAPASSPDVHGNQAVLLARSKCRNLTCSTCHDVHRPEASVAEIARACIRCHASVPHESNQSHSASQAGNCIDCHMPRQPSRVIVMNTDRGRIAQQYRNHTIGIYR